MHKTVYIEKDEEITSIVSKIKKEDGRDIFLVVPKGALLSQGMINLKLLKKEADRLEKDLFIITGDEKAKKIIAKVGLKIRELSSDDDGAKKEEAVDLFAEKASDETLEVLDKKEEAVREIGSASFFEKRELGEEGGEKLDRGSVPVAKEFGSGDLRKELYAKNRQNDEPREAELAFFQKNKQRPESSHEAKLPVLPLPRPRAGFSAENNLGARRLEVHKEEGGNSFNQRPPMIPKKDFQAESFRQAEDFFSEKKNQKVDPRKSFFQNSQPPIGFQKRSARPEEPKPGKAKWILLGVVLLFLLSFSGWAYWSWPKVNIKIYSRGTKVSGTAQVKVISDQAVLTEVDQIKGVYHEVEVEKTIEMLSSGVGSGSAQGKATGKVVILNKFSSASQNLVATTRLLSQDGKLFRLAKDVIVPGMEGETAGKIEAPVIADKAGDEYNVGASKFTIEGFKGGPKYEKFEVASSEAMSGGGAGDGTQAAKVVLQKDIDAARMKAMDEIGKDLSILVAEKIGKEDKYFIDSAGKEVVEAFADRRINEEGEKFNYTVKEKIKLISFKEADFKALVFDEIRGEAGEDFVLEEDKILFSYDKPIIDWDKKEMSVAVSYNGIVLPKLDVVQMKKELLGKNEGALKESLAEYSQLEKAEMEYYPSWAGRWSALERNFSIQESGTQE